MLDYHNVAGRTTTAGSHVHAQLRSGLLSGHVIDRQIDGERCERIHAIAGPHFSCVACVAVFVYCAHLYDTGCVYTVIYLGVRGLSTLVL